MPSYVLYQNHIEYNSINLIRNAIESIVNKLLKKTPDSWNILLGTFHSFELYKASDNKLNLDDLKQNFTQYYQFILFNNEIQLAFKNELKYFHVSLIIDENLIKEYLTDQNIQKIFPINPNNEGSAPVDKDSPNNYVIQFNLIDPYDIQTKIPNANDIHIDYNKTIFVESRIKGVNTTDLLELNQKVLFIKPPDSNTIIGVVALYNIP